MDAAGAAAPPRRPNPGAAPKLDVFELPDLLALILRLAASPNTLLVTKRVARGARAVPHVRRLILEDRWKGRILKGTAIFKGHSGEVQSCAFSPDGTRVVTTSADGTARLWDAATGAPLATLGHTYAVNSCVFSPDSRRVVTASSDKTARLWDAATGALLTTLEVHTDSIKSCAFSSDGKRLATASNDWTARLWDTATGALQTTLRGHTHFEQDTVAEDRDKVTEDRDDHEDGCNTAYKFIEQQKDVIGGLKEENSGLRREIDDLRREAQRRDAELKAAVAELEAAAIEAPSPPPRRRARPR